MFYSHVIERPYKGSTFSSFENRAVRYSLEGVGEKQVAYALLEPILYSKETMRLSGINVEEIESVVDSLSTLEKMPTFSSYGKLKDIALSYAVFYYLEKNNEFFYPTHKELEEHGVYLEKSREKEKEGIGLMLKYKGWIVIKKLSYKDAKPFMIAGTLAGIIDSVLPKFYSFLGFKEVKKGRKSLKNLSSLLSKIKAKGIERRYEVYRALLLSGISPYATLEMLAKVYPILKPKKPRGRVPK